MRFFSIWTPAFLMSTFMAVMLGLGLPNQIELRRLSHQGNLVDVEIVRFTESNFGKRHSYLLHFKYEGQEHAARISRNYMEATNKLRSTKLLHSTKHPDLFLQPGYDDEGEIASSYQLIGFFVFLAIFSLFKLTRK